LPSRETLWLAARQFWTGRIRLEHLLRASPINIALLYAFEMIPLTGIEKSFTITDFWRWQVVHLWAGDSVEFFAAAISAYLLMGVGLVSRQLAERALYLALILIFPGGVLGTGHPLYLAGEPGFWYPRHDVLVYRGSAPRALDHRGDGAAQAHRGTQGVQIWPCLYLHYRAGLLELRGRGRFQRRDPQRAADQLLRARHVSNSQPRA
jgi:nitric oxide reductase subunit B